MKVEDAIPHKPEDVTSPIHHMPTILKSNPHAFAAQRRRYVTMFPGHELHSQNKLFRIRALGKSGNGNRSLVNGTPATISPFVDPSCNCILLPAPHTLNYCVRTMTMQSDDGVGSETLLLLHLQALVGLQFGSLTDDVSSSSWS